MGALVAIAALIFVAATLRMLLVTPPERLAAFLRRAGPISLIVGGAGLTLIGRGAIGVPLLGLGVAAYQRQRSKGPPDTGNAPQSSKVRSDRLEMNLDHETGELDGTVLSGPFEGRSLSGLTQSELVSLRAELGRDLESLRLLEAYLDRRIPGWRVDAQTEAGDGLGGAPGSGAMTEQQAYEILGLEPGATLAEVREAHRRLLKRVHPDHGGTDFLAARINEAKAFLVERHR